MLSGVEKESVSMVSSVKKEWSKWMNTQETHQRLLYYMLADVWDNSFETQEHGERIAELAWRIGKKMNLTAVQLQDLVLLAKVHDLGKTMISHKILNKPGTLDDLEWDEMRMHPIFGARIALLTPVIRHLADGIMAHHERWDGQGYPYGLAGEAIPLAARIIAAADALDTMMHGTSYRRAAAIGRALSEMKSQSGKQFDPAIVTIIIELMTGQAE